MIFAVYPEPICKHRTILAGTITYLGTYTYQHDITSDLARQFFRFNHTTASLVRNEKGPHGWIWKTDYQEFGSRRSCKKVGEDLPVPILFSSTLSTSRHFY
jgi:hypothetical protein